MCRNRIVTNEIELWVNLKICDSKQDHADRDKRPKHKFEPMHFLLVIQHRYDHCWYKLNEEISQKLAKNTAITR